MATDIQTLLVDRQAGQPQLRRFGVACAVLALIAVALVPVAGRPLMRLPETAAVFGSVVAVLDLITFLLLATRAGNDASPPVRAIACAYLFSGLMALLHVATFPGAVLPDRPLLGSRDTVGLLFLAWRFGFSLLLLIGVMLDVRGRTTTPKPSALARASGVTVALVGVSLFLALWIPQHLPDTAGGAFGLGPWASAWSAAAVCLAALLIIWRTRRLHRTLYLWIGFVLLANALGLCVSETGGARYTVGWYTARAYAVLASGVLLALLLHEVLELQRSLSASVAVLGERAQELQAEIQRRETAEHQLAHARQLELVGQLAGGVAHDFNNHLQIISTRVELLRRRSGDLAQTREDFEVLGRTLRRAKGLTQHLLSVSGRRPQQPQIVDLAQWLPLCSEMLRSLLPSHVALDLDIPGEPCPVSIDGGELESALTNLVANARDAAPSSDGRIAIALRHAGGQGAQVIELLVRDNGCGMAPEVLQRAFEPFFTTKPLGTGHGLGLSQVQVFAERSHGGVFVESRVGAGTSVRLAFPAASMPVGPAHGGQARLSPSGSFAGYAALVVDDNTDVADSTAALLEHLGMTVMRASNADEAIALLARHDSRPRLVLTDIMMTGAATGLTLARRLRKDRADVAVVLCTGYSQLGHEAAHEGFIILMKPYKEDELLLAIERALRQEQR